MATSDELKQMECPSCGKLMTHGFVAGHWTRLRWVSNDKSKTIFAGSPLRKKVDWLNAPTLEAVRCQQCKIGVFRYDY